MMRGFFEVTPVNVKAVFELAVEAAPASSAAPTAAACARPARYPPIMYGGGEGPESMMLDHNALVRQMNREAFYTSILTLKIGSKAQQVIVKDVQRHPAQAADHAPRLPADPRGRGDHAERADPLPERGGTRRASRSKAASSTTC